MALLSALESKFSVVIAVGPGERELLRLREVIRGLSRFESEWLHELVVVDDTCGLHDLQTLPAHQRLQPQSISLRVIQTPRQGQGDGWRGGLTANILFGIQNAFTDGIARFVIKLDTDSLVIRPFSQQLVELYDRDPQLGVVGSGYATDLHGRPAEPSTWKVNLRKWEKLIRIRRNPLPHIESALWGRNRRIRQYVKAAIANGWDTGAAASGGGYAVGRELYKRWSARQMLDDPLLWIHTDLTEDVVVTMLCKAVGMSIVDDNSPGDVFGVQYVGLAFPPREMIERGYGIIHSVKCKEWETELALRATLWDLLNSERESTVIYR